ncbi:hypothetical protein BV22DRAFT_107349 [Leucogyrophana mollusca]|uniref:Uncharacterized protein n=1 Tax=Leucogyrophana mollusca TaxID=85980 RepID=A0ACB8BW44_9AGAM|nr:hypothetical protein BV22DRAFT_107349 [Leucogyrophana mollusca]
MRLLTFVIGPDSDSVMLIWSLSTLLHQVSETSDLVCCHKASHQPLLLLLFASKRLFSFVNLDAAKRTSRPLAILYKLVHHQHESLAWLLILFEHCHFFVPILITFDFISYYLFLQFAHRSS